ncbi:hypothetical protein Sjap_004743 [Stephania japonica]|uniref:Uncharacterized protein n=1 Tax=Stephania japonica TaxID=461633 RepID=A0AAP0K552_9MAGN
MLKTWCPPQRQIDLDASLQERSEHKKSSSANPCTIPTHSFGNVLYFHNDVNMVSYYNKTFRVKNAMHLKGGY